MYQLFVARLQKTDLVHHFSEEAGHICSTTEAKEVDLIPRAVISLQKLITAHDMVSQCRADRSVFDFHIRGLDII